MILLMLLLLSMLLLMLLLMVRCFCCSGCYWDGVGVVLAVAQLPLFLLLSSVLAADANASISAPSPLRVQVCVAKFLMWSKSCEAIIVATV
jgi:hypothetical protein